MPFYLLFVESGCQTSSIRVQWRLGGLDGPLLRENAPSDPIRWRWVIGGGSLPQRQLRFSNSIAGTFGIELFETRADKSGGDEVLVWRQNIQLALDSDEVPLEWPTFRRAYGCDAIEHLYEPLQDEMLARWSSVSYPYTQQAMEQAITSAQCGGTWFYPTVVHHGVYAQRVFSLHQRARGSYDSPFTADVLRSVARKVRLPNLHMLVLSEDGPREYTPTMHPMFFYTAFRRSLMLPNFQHLRDWLDGSLVDHLVRCKGHCFADRAQTLYWRGRATGYSHTELRADTFSAYPRFRAALMAAADMRRQARALSEAHAAHSNQSRS
jgi:hypothetical protein